MPDVQIAILVIAALIGSGGLAFFLRYHTRLVLAERDAAKALSKAEEHDKELAAQKERVALMETTLNSIRDSLSRLHVVDRIMSAVDVLKERVEDNRRDTAELRTELRQFISGLPVSPKRP